MAGITFGISGVSSSLREVVGVFSEPDPEGTTSKFAGLWMCSAQTGKIYEASSPAVLEQRRGLIGWACRTTPSASPSSVRFAWAAWLLFVCSQMLVATQNIDVQRRSPVLRRPSPPRPSPSPSFASPRRASSGPSPLPASERSSAPERTPPAHRVSAEGTPNANSVLDLGAQQQQGDAVNIECNSKNGSIVV